MKKYLVLIISTSVLFVATAVMTTMIITQLNQYADRKAQIAETMNAETRLGNVTEWLPEPFNWTSDDVNAKHKRLDREANGFYAQGIKYGVVLLGVVVLYALMNLIAYSKSQEKIRMYGISMLAAALAFLSVTSAAIVTTFATIPSSSKIGLYEASIMTVLPSLRRRGNAPVTDWPAAILSQNSA